MAKYPIFTESAARLEQVGWFAQDCPCLTPDGTGSVWSVVAFPKTKPAGPPVGLGSENLISTWAADRDKAWWQVCAQALALGNPP